jgi:hypothetical protein
MAKTKMDVLEMIDRGEITAEEGMRMLANLDNEQTAPNKPAGGKSPQMELLEKIERGEASAQDVLQELGVTDSEKMTPGDSDVSPEPEVLQGSARVETKRKKDPATEGEFRKWRDWWTIPFAIGLTITVLAGIWMNNNYQDNGLGFWFFCAWAPLLIGIALTALSFGSRHSPWVHVRVDKKDTLVRLSLPLPIGISSWGLRTFGHYLPNMDATALDEVISALDSTFTGDSPLYVVVDDDDDGEHVEVFIG